MAVATFVKEAPQSYDLTMLGLKYYETGERKMKELVIDAVTENLDAVMGFITEQLEAVDCSMKALMQIEVAVEELFVNIAHYAYAPKTGTATIQTEINADNADITFIDSGMQYDPLAKPDPDVSLPASERQIGGLGIFMVKKSMDDMRYEYRNGKNILTITKKLS